VSKRFCVSEVVDRDQIDLRIAKPGTNHRAADTAKTIDANFDSH
jgi:hypothetical protein